MDNFPRTSQNEVPSIENGIREYQPPQMLPIDEQKDINDDFSSESSTDEEDNSVHEERRQESSLGSHTQFNTNGATTAPFPQGFMGSSNMRNPNMPAQQAFFNSQTRGAQGASAPQGFMTNPANLSGYSNPTYPTNVPTSSNSFYQTNAGFPNSTYTTSPLLYTDSPYPTQQHLPPGSVNSANSRQINFPQYTTTQQTFVKATPYTSSTQSFISVQNTNTPQQIFTQGAPANPPQQIFNQGAPASSSQHMFTQGGVPANPNAPQTYPVFSTSPANPEASSSNGNLHFIL